MHEKNDLNVALTAKLTKRSTCIAANAEWPKVLAITAAEVSDETPLPAKQKLPNFRPRFVARAVPMRSNPIVDVSNVDIFDPRRGFVLIQPRARHLRGSCQNRIVSQARSLSLSWTHAIRKYLKMNDYILSNHQDLQTHATDRMSSVKL